VKTNRCDFGEGNAAEVARSLVVETFCEPKTDDAQNLDSNTLIATEHVDNSLDEVG
jgi:hypothetical protein